MRRISSSSLVRALDVLELLALRGPLRAAEIAAELDLVRPTLYRTLRALESRGYVRRSAGTPTYALGPALARLAARADTTLLVPLAMPALRALHATTRETVNLAGFDGRRIVYVEMIDAAYSLRPTAVVGQEVPPHATAIGKAILSALAAHDRDALLGPEPYAAFTARTITTRARLDAELRACSERGFAFDHEETEPGAACVGAAVLDPDGRPLGAVSVTGITARLDHDALSALGADVRIWTERITNAFAAHGRGETPTTGGTARPSSPNREE